MKLTRKFDLEFEKLCNDNNNDNNNNNSDNNSKTSRDTESIAFLGDALIASMTRLSIALVAIVMQWLQPEVFPGLLPVFVT